jgi:hypothetical protein
MVRRESFINKIRSLRYEYKTQQKRTYLYRRKGGTHYISVPMADLLEDEFVLSSLRQAGEKDHDIRAFINNYSAVV